MATVNKDFKVKHGLIVEGTTGTIDGNDILTKNQDSDTYIVNLIGGETLVKSVGTNLSVDLNGQLSLDEAGIASDLAGTRLYADGSTLNIDEEGLFDDFVSNGMAVTTDISTALQDYTTTSNLDTTVGGYGYLKNADLPTMYSDSDVDAHLYGGDGINYFEGQISVRTQSNGGIERNNGEIRIDRTIVDTWYDANGAAGDVASDLSDHISDTSTHGVTGDIVGTSDTQTLTNKTINDELHFTNPATQAYDGGIVVNNSSEDFEITAYTANLHLKGQNDVTVTAINGDIVLNADGTSYLTSASAGNEIATHSYVDNAVSGLAWKQAVNLLATSNVTVASSVEGLVIDGHPALTTADTGYRLLLTGQSTDSENGIWQTFAGDGTLYIQRTPDADVYSELIGAAVYVMEGTQFGSTSWVQGNHYLTTFVGQDWTQFSGQGSVTAGSGITVDGLEVSIDRTTVDTWYDEAGAAGIVAGNLSDHESDTSTHGVTGAIVGTTDSQTLTNKTIDASDNTISNIANSSLTNSSITVNGYATSLGDTVTLDTDDVSEGTAQYFTDSRAKDSAASLLTNATLSNITITGSGSGLTITAENGVADSDTDDLDEGSTNLYFTDGRAKDSAASLLTNATLSNITITGTGAGLTITAENGVADSTTDELDEGSTNLYFTDERAVSALQNVTPNFYEIDVNSIARQIAAQTGNIATASTNTVYSFAHADYRSAKFLIKTAYGTHTELTEVLLTLDSSNNIAITEYATVGTNGSSMLVTADIDMGNVRLRVQTLNSNSIVTVTGTLLA